MTTIWKRISYIHMKHNLRTITIIVIIFSFNCYLREQQHHKTFLMIHTFYFFFATNFTTMH